MALTPLALKADLSGLLATPGDTLLLGSPLGGGFTFASPRSRKAAPTPGLALQDSCISLELLLAGDAENRSANNRAAELFTRALAASAPAGQAANANGESAARQQRPALRRCRGLGRSWGPLGADLGAQGAG